MKNFFPLLIVTNINALSSYLVDKFKFTTVFDSDWYKHLDFNGMQIGVMVENSQNQPEFLHTKLNGDGFVLTIEVENVDEVYKQFKDEIIHPLKTEEWGQRHFIIRAPEGVLIDVVNYTEPDDYE